MSRTDLIATRKFHFAELEQASLDYVGFCLACGGARDNCEPDARKYECPNCGAHEVYGAEELVIMGRVA